ncbi:MAG: AMP-binding protein, partial [Pseudomonadota bacterium]|nr:AMP-binding protein [Pseudomonadota bacterium]
VQAGGDRPPPLGLPIANTQIHVLDSRLNPAPAGVAGEIHIGGGGLARGYLNRPALTAEKFIPDPFGGGGRLYKTGDLGRRRPDGGIEYLGRIDHQVKLRGFRIEPGEIEAAILRHPEVREAVVMALADRAEPRLCAFFTRREAADAGLQAQQLDRWRQIWNDAYRRPDAADPGFNVAGWNDSYTGQAIHREAMAEWVEATVGQILARRPQRVLEIGCGTGLLLLRIAPQCHRYLGTDISTQALAWVEGQLSDDLRRRVTLLARPADDFGGVTPQSFDAVILNSVIQYFPDVDYLLAVLEGAMAAAAPGGFVYVGDVRSLPLLEAFHASVQLHRAPAGMIAGELRQLVRKQRDLDTELVLDPEFFTALHWRLPRLGGVQVQLKRGRWRTEVTRFRYDVTLHVEDSGAEVPWRDWRAEGWTLAALRQHLAEAQPEAIGLRGVPNARLVAEMQLLERLAGADAATAGELRAETAEQPGVEPEDLRALGESLPYEVYLGWSRDDPAAFDAVLRRRRPGQRPYFEPRCADAKPWERYANNPLHGERTRRLAAALPAFLRESLPEYMIPSAFIPLEALPLTPNGKIDRRALAAGAAPPRTDAYVAPRNPTEARLAAIWAEVLGVRVGVHDDFFALGGHSLLATQVVARIREALPVEPPLRLLFEAPTVAGLAARLEALEERQEGPPLLPVPRQGDLPVSFAQQRLWFLDQLEGPSATYNIAAALRLRGALNLPALERSLKEMVGRHETLRTTIQTLDGRPLARIQASGFTLAVTDLTALPAETRDAEARRLA